MCYKQTSNISISVVRTLLALHRTATLRHDELGQVI